MCKTFLINEYKKMFNCTEETIRLVTRKTLIGLGVYGAVILLVFGLVVAFSGTHSFFLAGLFGFILWALITLLIATFSLFMFTIFMYYGAYFVRQGWERR